VAPIITAPLHPHDWVERIGLEAGWRSFISGETPSMQISNDRLCALRSHRYAEMSQGSRLERYYDGTLVAVCASLLWKRLGPRDAQNGASDVAQEDDHLSNMNNQGSVCRIVARACRSPKNVTLLIVPNRQRLQKVPSRVTNGMAAPERRGTWGIGDLPLLWMALGGASRWVAKLLHGFAHAETGPASCWRR
jgi:hypothetical protein